jgi:DNA-binding NarL/FixJ family response regulator
MRVTTATAGSGDNLSSWERQVVMLVAHDVSDRELARMVGVSVNGAKLYVRNILRKLDLSDRSELADWRADDPDWW